MTTPQEKSRCCPECSWWEPALHDCTCECHQPSPADTKVEDWRQEFDKEFYNTENMRWGMTVYEISTGKTATWREKAHAFIERTLSSQRDTLVEGLEALKKVSMGDIDVGPINIPDIETQAWNDALDAAIKLIKETR
jgi:hypothetical protein